MGQEDMKKCPYCAEQIKREAIKCRYCGSMLTEKKNGFDFLSTPGYWHRVNEGKKIAGVCTGIAHQLDAPMLILPLRLFFILTTIFYGFGFILYIILWALMAPPTDSETMQSNGTATGYYGQNSSNKPAPPPVDKVDDDFDYVEGSTPAPEEFKPETETAVEPEQGTDSTGECDADDATGDTTVQKRILLTGMAGALLMSTILAGKVYIGIARELMLPVFVQLPVALFVITAIAAVFHISTRLSRRHTPATVMVD